MVAVVAGVLVAARAPGAEQRFYVSPQGNDAWSGRLAEPNADHTDGPWASLGRAREAIRQMKARAGGLSGPVTVLLRGGVYVVTETLSFGPEDSGTRDCPIAYAAYPGEKPVLCGGRRITHWQPVPDGKGRLRADLAAVHPGPWSFRSLFVDGRRQIRARYPNVDPTDPYRKGFLYVARSPGGFGQAVGCIHNPGDWMEYEVTVPADGRYRFWIYYGALNRPHGTTDMSGRTVLSVDGGKPIPLADLADTGDWNPSRWAMSTVLELTRGRHVLRWQNVKGGGLNLEAYALCDDPAWKPVGVELAPPASGRHLVVIQAEDFIRSHGKQLAVSGVGGSKTAFYFEPGTFKPSWAVPGAELHIFQSGDCRAFKEIVSIEQVDPRASRVTLSGKECRSYLGTGDRYFVENVLEELDSPGEWYLDVKTRTLYYQPPAGVSRPVEAFAPVVGRLMQFLARAGKGATGVSHIRLAGLTFQVTDYSPDDGCEGYGMGRDGVLYFEGATACTVEECTFQNIGKYAVCLRGGGDHTIRGNDVADSAQGGVLVIASTRNTIGDNHIHHCGAVYKHIGGVVIEGAGADDNVVAHNEIHDIARYGITLKNAGLRNVIEYNRVLRTNLETYDTGGIEVTQHDRDQRSGSTIRSNIVGDTIGYSSIGSKDIFLSWGIYLDSFAGGYTVTDNITYRNSHGGIMLQGGKDNRVFNNIFVDSTVCQALIANHAGNSTGQVLERNIFAWSHPQATLFNLGAVTPQVIRVDYNLYFCAGAGEIRLGWGGRSTFADWQKQGFDAHSLVADPRFVDPKQDNYGLRPDSPALKLGFKPIDTREIGLRRARCRCPARPWPAGN